MALGLIGSVLWGFNMLLEVLEKMRDEYSIEKRNNNDQNQKLSHLATCVDHAHGLLSKYWDKKHHNRVKKKTQALYREFHIEDAGTSSSTDSESSVKKRKMEGFDINTFRFGGGGGDVQDELQCYLKTPKEVLPTDEANVAFDILA